MEITEKAPIFYEGVQGATATPAPPLATLLTGVSELEQVWGGWATVGY